MKIYRIFVCFTIFLSSCSSNSMYKELSDSLRYFFQDPQDISADIIEKIPYSTMQARLGKAPNTVIVLEEIRDNIYKWTSSNFIKIYTNNGLVIKVSGLENDLDSLDLDIKHPLITKKFSEDEGLYLNSFYNFKNPNLFNLSVRTYFSYQGYEKITKLGSEIDAKVFTEFSSGDNLIKWKFKNTYWVDPDTYEIIKSIQNITPKNPAFYSKILK